MSSTLATEDPGRQAPEVPVLERMDLTRRLLVKYGTKTKGKQVRCIRI